jgi:beta-lactamase class A
MSRRSVYIVLAGIVILGLGGGIGYLIGQHRTPLALGSEVRLNSSEYKFINPILLAEIGQKDQFPQFNAFNKTIQKYIDTAKAQGKATSVSVYLRDLDSAAWTGVNEDEVYAPASMLKVALMIAYLKEAETDPTILDKKLLYQGDDNSIENYKPEHPLVQGRYYTIRELIQDMIVQSSNVSNDVLLKNIDPVLLTRVYTDLALPLPTDKALDFLSAKSYSALFRSLYSATYLSRPYSNAALELLTHSDFYQGIEAGVPQSALVAHKFGERTKLVNGIPAERELHDCGIVYYSDNPYFICIMTRGSAFSDLQTIIEDISHIAYTSIVAIHTSQK